MVRPAPDNLRILTVENQGRSPYEESPLCLHGQHMGLVSNPTIIASQDDGVLLALDAQNTRKGALRESLRGLDGFEARILGTVMNNVKKGKGGYYGYTYEQAAPTVIDGWRTGLSASLSRTSIHRVPHPRHV